jgi:hypothetical protein
MLLDLLAPATQLLARLFTVSISREDILSAGEETALLWELCSRLSLSADAPCEGDNADDCSAHNGSVGLPVLWLGVPTTGWRPDVLWVSVIDVLASGGRSESEEWKSIDIRNLAAAALRPVSMHIQVP